MEPSPPHPPRDEPHVRSPWPALRPEDVHAHPSDARTLHRTALCLSFHLHSLQEALGFCVSMD